VPAAEGELLSVQLSGGTEKIDYIVEKNVLYFSMSQLAELFGDRISWEEVGLSIVYQSSASKTIFFVDSPFLRMGDSVRNMVYPVIIRNGELYLPAETFMPVLNRIRPEQISWDAHRKTIRVDSEWYNVTDLAFSPKANGLLIEIFVSGIKDYEIFQSEGNWLNITIPNGTVNRRQILSRRNRDFLVDMNVLQNPGSAQVSLRLRRKIDKMTHRLQIDPDRIQISLIDSLVAPIANNELKKVGPDDLIDRIIIDPGHGGSDYGAIGHNGTREKDVVLDIAKRLAKIIRKDKIFSAVLTREKDEYLSLAERTRIANEEKGDIFVSIHANASVKRAARGFQVFFLAPAKNDSARAVAQLENATFLAELGNQQDSQYDDLSHILSDMIQTEFQTESADLAAMIERDFRRKVNSTDSRGIDQAGFYVLNGVYMPSVLVESAFITNRGDEQLLKSKDFREEVAQAIYEGLKRFKAKYENK
jgi:N-acetylmuramoyl-L-alanine amidase